MTEQPKVAVVGFSGYASHVVVDPVLVGSVSLCAVLGSFAEGAGI